MNLSLLQKTLLAAVFVSVAVVVAWFFLRSGGPFEASPVVAEIGSYRITEQQLKLRQEHANVYYPGSGDPEVALAQLIQGYLAAELMRQQGVELDRATWLAEEERIEKQTRDPGTLARLKAVYAQSHDDYLYVGILPDFAQSRLYRLFRSSSAFSKEAREKAGRLLEAAGQNPERFAEEARKSGATVRRLLVDPKKGMSPEDEVGTQDAPSMQVAGSPHESQIRAEWEARAGEQERQAAESLLARLQSLSPGQVYRHALDSPESIDAARLVAWRDGGAAVVELAGFPKSDFGGWFWREAAKVPVRIARPELKDALRKKVSWARQLRMVD